MNMFAAGQLQDTITNGNSAGILCDDYQNMRMNRQYKKQQ